MDTNRRTIIILHRNFVNSCFIFSFFEKLVPNAVFRTVTENVKLLRIVFPDDSYAGEDSAPLVSVLEVYVEVNFFDVGGRDPKFGPVF